MNTIKLEVGPNGENIHVEKQPDGNFAAYDQDNYDLGSPVGYGKTADEAIEDLKENTSYAKAYYNHFDDC